MGIHSTVEWLWKLGSQFKRHFIPFCAEKSCGGGCCWGPTEYNDKKWRRRRRRRRRRVVARATSKKQGALPCHMLRMETGGREGDEEEEAKETERETLHERPTSSGIHTHTRWLVSYIQRRDGCQVPKKNNKNHIRVVGNRWTFRARFQRVAGILLKLKEKKKKRKIAATSARAHAHRPPKTEHIYPPFPSSSSSFFFFCLLSKISEWMDVLNRRCFGSSQPFFTFLTPLARHASFAFIRATVSNESMLRM